MAPRVTLIDNTTKPDETKNVRTQSSNKDRDGNGRREPDAAPKKQHLTDEEMTKAIAYLKALPGIVSNSLVVRLDSSHAVRVVVVEDLQGKVIRRIPEPDLWTLITDHQDKKTGQIFDKAM